MVYGAGGGTDVLARAFSEASRKHLNQPLTVVNKPGASGAIGLTDVLNAKPDGYKIAMITIELTTLPHVGVIKFSYEDFAPIALLNADPAAITVKSDAQWNTIDEFLAAAKKAPGEFRVGNSGAASIWHLAAAAAAAALEDKTGVKFNHIPYPGAGPANLSLLGGHIEAVAVSAAEVTAQVAAGKMKVLAVMADKRLKGLENVPTLKERNIDVAISAWRATEIAKILAQPDVKERLDGLGLAPSGMSPAQFTAFNRSEIVKWANLVKTAGLKMA